MKKTFLLLWLLAAALLLCACGKKPAAAPVAIDLDLSQMSGTMVYSQVYNMMADPDPYLGKTVRITGLFDYYKDAATNKLYLACIIPDATACCSQGIEFEWAGEHAYPEDYPEPGTGVTVTGRLDSYVEDEWLFLCLRDTEVIWSPQGQEA